MRIATINREDFGIGWGKNFGFDMDVKLAIQVEALRRELSSTEGNRMRDAVVRWLMLALAWNRDRGRRRRTPLFDGKTLDGLEAARRRRGLPGHRRRHRRLVAARVPNSFLVTEKDYGDFILEFDVRQDVGPTNSGVQFRSLSTPEFENGRVHGYQADIDPSAAAMERRHLRRGAARLVLHRRDESAGQGALQVRRVESLPHRGHRPAPARVDQRRRRPPTSSTTPRSRVSSACRCTRIDKPEEAGRTTSWKNLACRRRTSSARRRWASSSATTCLTTSTPRKRRRAGGCCGTARPRKGWRSAKPQGFPAKGWSLANGELAVLPKGGGGDIMTDEEFGAFELQMEFKVSAGANSGIFYLLTSPHDPASGAPLGLEYQILDDERHPDAKLGIDGNRTLASLYDILPRAKLMTNVGIAPKVDVWQHARIVARRRRHGGALAERREGAGVQARLGRLPRARRGQQVQGDAGIRRGARRAASCCRTTATPWLSAASRSASCK